MNKPIKSIVVVGGGTAGWITAGRIAAHHQSQNPDISIDVTLIESPGIPPIGVGEGTWPTMRNTLHSLGIRETDFIRECDASFKQGAKFAKWVTGKDDDFYYHPLVLPQGFAQCNLAPYWQQQYQAGSPFLEKDESFSNAVCFQESLCENGLAPKLITTAEYSAIANYAYHLNSAKFSAFLQKHCTEKLGVKHILDDVVEVRPADDGDIEAVMTKNNGAISGDLFVDCTGFSSLLLGQHYEVPFVDCSDTLFVDSALAVQVPYDSEDAAIASHTISTGTSAGWVWDIGLPNRRGVGHVFSSRHTSEDAAHDELSAYLGPAIKNLDVRKIPIRSGHRKIFWKNNCVAVGLSAGFLEPLEASALVLVEMSATMIAEQLPACRDVMDIVAKRFNETFTYRWQRIIDFLKLHYMLTKRNDSQFWIDNRDPDTIPESLKDLLKLWRYHSPYDHDFTSTNEVFPAASYQYVLYGMGFETDYANTQQTLNKTKIADEMFAKNKQMIAKTLDALPSNRDLINRIKEFGLQTI